MEETKKLNYKNSVTNVRGTCVRLGNYTYGHADDIITLRSKNNRKTWTTISVSTIKVKQKRAKSIKVCLSTHSILKSNSGFVVKSLNDTAIRLRNKRNLITSNEQLYGYLWHNQYYSHSI